MTTNNGANTRQALNAAQKYRLARWVEEVAVDGRLTMTEDEAAEQAAETLGFPLRRHSIRSARNAVGVKAWRVQDGSSLRSLQRRIDRLEDRLDDLEACVDNPRPRP